MQYIEEQVQGILSQINVDLMIFASLDHSSNDSEAWLNKLAQQDTGITLLPYGEKFGGAARNFFV